MTIDYSTLIQQSSMGILLLFSLATWAVLLLKAWQQGSAKRQNRNYTQAFWAAQDFDAALRSGPEKSQLARLAQVTTRALSNGQDGHEPTDSWSRQELLERSLHQQIHGERRALESGMIVLASIGSTAPFIGLFGTVFGIIHALQAISTAKSASIAIVAGPIGEALIATGVGIAVAVPAVLAY
ncbi:MotA/TolQ/ExbB proton channel family protein, partial [Pseudomonas viridiflava]